MAERIQTSALNRRSGEIVTRASMGESFELTRFGKVVALLGPPQNTSSTSSEEMQMDPVIAVSPTLRPTQHSDPQRASKTAQQQRDDLLRGSRRS